MLLCYCNKNKDDFINKYSIKLDNDYLIILFNIALLSCYNPFMNSLNLIVIRVGPDIRPFFIPDIETIRPYIWQYNLSYFTTKIPVNKQSQALILKPLVLNSKK